MRFPGWTDERAPHLGDVICQTSAQGTEDEDWLRRSYLVVGLEETRTGWRLVLERVEHGTIPDPADPQAAMWTFFNLPR